MGESPKGQPKPVDHCLTAGERIFERDCAADESSSHSPQVSDSDENRGKGGKEKNKKGDRKASSSSKSAHKAKKAERRKRRKRRQKEREDEIEKAEGATASVREKGDESEKRRTSHARTRRTAAKLGGNSRSGTDESTSSGLRSPQLGQVKEELEALKDLTKRLEEKLGVIESSDNQHEEEESTDCYDEEDEEEPSASAGKRSASTHRSTRPVANHSDYSADSDGERKIRKSVSLTDLRSANHSTDIAMIKDKHRKEKNFQDKTDKRERARGRRETSREVSNPASVSGSGTHATKLLQSGVSPFGSTQITKSQDYCYSSLMKTDVPSRSANRMLWKRRVLGIGQTGVCLIKPYSEILECVWSWPTIQQWIINDKLNIIKFLIESDSSSSSEEERKGEGENSDQAHITTYTFRVDNAEKVSESLRKVVKRVKKARLRASASGGTTPVRSDDEKIALTKEEERHHHRFAFLRALTHSLSKDKGHKETSHPTNEHQPKMEKERKHSQKK